MVSADFRASFVALNDGRVLSGIIGSQSKESILLITPTERLTIGTQDIKKIKPSEASLMPDGLLSTLKPEQVPDLVAYLMTRAQVPLPDEKK